MLFQASAQTQAEAAIRDHLPSQVLQIQARLQRHEESLDSIHGQLSQLTRRVVQLRTAAGITLVQDEIPYSPLSVNTTQQPLPSMATAEPTLAIHVPNLPLSTDTQDALHVLDGMPVYDVYGEETDGYSNSFINVLDDTPSGSGHESILGRPLDLDKHLAHGGGTQQVFEEMSQPYGLHSLDCRNLTLADGTVHSYFYFALPDDYPLERATSATSPTLAEGGSVMDVNPPVVQTEGWTGPVHDASLPATPVNAGPSTPILRTQSDDNQQHNGFTNSSGSMYISDAVVTGSETRDMPITDFQAFHDDENLLVGKSDSELLQKSFNFTLAHAPYFRFLYVPDVHVGKVQHTKAYKWSMLLPEEGRKDWDPGASVNLLLFTSMNTYYYYSLSCNQKQISKLCSALQALMCDATAPEDKIFGDPYTSVENDYKLQLAQTIVPSHNSRTATIAVIRSQDYSFQWEARLQWDPGANMAYFYSWLQIFSEFEKPLQLTQDCSLKINIGIHIKEISVADFSLAIQRAQLHQIQTQQWHMMLITEDCFADQEVMAKTSSKMAALTWHGSITGTPLILLSSTTYIWDPGVVYIIDDMMLDKYAVSHQVQFVQLKAEYLFLSLTACIQYIAPNGINSVLHATCFILRRAAHLTQDNYFCSLHCISVLKTYYIWDPGTMLLWYKSKWWLLYTEEKTNWHKDIKRYGIAHWLIIFNPP